MGRTGINYFDPAPVLALQREDEADQTFAVRVGVSRQTVARWRSGAQLYRSAAERAAIRLERHPLDLWPDVAVLDEDWRKRARCRDTLGFFHLAEHPPEADLTEEGRRRRDEIAERKAKARKMCANCRVQTSCLDWVLRNVPESTDVGIWAGTTRNQRKRMRKALQQKVA